MASGDIVSQTNDKIVGMFSGVNLAQIGGWIAALVLIIGGGFFIWRYYRDKKIFNKTITAFEIVGSYYEPAIRDTAKTVKIGRGGFEIQYLKKSKTWKIAYGGRVGKSTYYYFIGKDGYWYNSRLSADINEIDKRGGLIPIVTTNPLMRSQYTSLEKQIDLLHNEKTSFMDKYGSWVFAIGFLVVAGMFLWLNYQEYVKAMGSMAGLTDKLGQMMDKANAILGNAGVAANGGTGLVKVGA